MPYLKASDRGLEKIKQARNEGWKVDDPQWLVEASKVLKPNLDWPIVGPFADGISEGTWKAFLYNTRKEGISTEVFKAYCKVLGLEWEEIKKERLPQQHSGRSEVSDRTLALVEEYTKLFVGRSEILELLDKFLIQSDNRWKIITARAGFGKTALLANWVKSRQGNGVFIAYHFFSHREEITRPVANAYRNLLQQLYNYCELSKPLSHNETKLREALHDFVKDWKGKPLVVVLDGLDEADRPFSPPFPTPLSQNVFVIASARASEGEQLEYLSGWTKDIEPIHLDRLPRCAIADWLQETGKGELVTLAQDETFVTQVCDRTEGIPLFLKYLIDELLEVAQQGEESAIRKTLAATPKGFAEYIRQQYQALNRLEDWRSRPDMRKIFYFLTIAKGELSSDDLVELMGESPVGLPWQVSRWFKIRQLEDCLVFSFAHSTLAEQFAVLPEIQANTKKSQKELIKYCAQWDEYQSPYAFRHYAEHLRDVKHWEELYAIARNEDFYSHSIKQFPDEPDLPLKTVQTALLAAAEEDKAGEMAEFMLLHARQLLQTTAQDSPLDALRSGNLNRAHALADLYEIERCALWYLLLAWELKDTNQLNEAQATLEKLRKKNLVRGLSTSGVATHGTRASYVEYAAYILAYVSDINKDAFTELRQRLLYDYQQVPLCETLIVRGYLTIALETALSMEDGWWKIHALADIAVAQAQDGDKTASQKTLKFILETTEPIDDKLSKIAAAQAKLGDFDAALTTVQTINNRQKQAWALGEIAIAQAQVGHKEAARANLAVAVDTARTINDEWQKAEALQDVAIAQAKAGEFINAMKTAKETGWECTQVNVLRSIIKVLASKGDVNGAFQVVNGMPTQSQTEKITQLQLLQPIAEAFAENQNFNAALSLVDKMVSNKAHMIGVIASKMAQVGLRDEARAIFACVLTTATWFKPPEQKQVEALATIGQVQAEVRLKNESRATFTIALEMAHKIHNQGSKDWAFQTLAEKQVQSGEHTAALNTVETIEDEGRLLTVLLLIAVAHGQVRDKDTAQTIFTRALDITRKLDNEPSKEAILRTIAKGQAQIRDFDAARETAKENGQDFTLPQVLGIIGQIQAQDGETKRARSTFTEAVTQAKKLEKVWERSWTLRTIAEAQAQTQSQEFLNIAWETALEIDDKREKLKAMLEIVKVQIQLKQFSAGLGITREINAEGEQAVEVLAIAAECQIEVEDREAVQETYANALRLVRQIRDDGIEARALETVAKSQAKSSFGFQAIRTTEMILINRYQHLPNVAAILAEIGDKQNFKRLLIPCAYYLDATYEMCGYLAKLYPEQASAVTKVLSELN
ncbi:ATP-binding protein [Microcoleus sp. T2B6]|uniref:ATP-binding protein n=1 Tax=Microcoleus sp. T2B6 TaxID=3055424 RepID=UPI002FCF0397